MMLFGALQAYIPTKQETAFDRQRLQTQVYPHCIAIPEGGFVYYFNPQVKPWLEKRFNLKTIQNLRLKLAPFLILPLSKEGFTMASSRKSEEEVDETNYSAIWVRDASWHYFGLKIGDPPAAKKLLLKLIEFYSTAEQMGRFLSVIALPEIADPTSNPNVHMEVPLIRFSRKTLSHHQVDGKDQLWNHLQFDSHGLFLLAVADGTFIKNN